MIATDDLIYRVDRHYLGPAGVDFFRIRYTAFGIAVTTFALTMYLLFKVLHMSFGMPTITIAFLVTLFVTMRVGRYITPDRPLRAVVRAAWNDLNAPRQPKAQQTVTVDLPDRVRARRPARATLAKGADS